MPANIGLAFQIADDLIDHEGDEAAAGKRCARTPTRARRRSSRCSGAERARQQARMLVSQAIGHLGAHGEEADMLRAIARFAVERDH